MSIQIDPELAPGPFELHQQLAEAVEETGSLADAAPLPSTERPDAGAAAARLPPARGPLTAGLFAALRGAAPAPTAPEVHRGDVLLDEDLQLALYVSYELHYRGFDDADPDAEWDPALLAFRAGLEQALLAGLHREVAARIPLLPAEPRSALLHLSSNVVGPSLSAFAEQRASLAQIRELCIHRSAYQRKEADPHTWALPRFGGAAKAALVEIQRDEYGNGVEAEMHAELFSTTMRSLGLDSTYGHYLARIPAVTLATTNLISLFGLHRRWRGALVGHLALFEMTSRGPMARYSAALERLGVPADGRRFYDVHVEVDAHHERVALDELVPAVLRDDPDLGPDVIFGAAALTAVEARFTRELLAAWRAGRSSLRLPADTVASATAASATSASAKSA